MTKERSDYKAIEYLQSMRNDFYPRILKKSLRNKNAALQTKVKEIMNGLEKNTAFQDEFINLTKIKVAYLQLYANRFNEKNNEIDLLIVNKTAEIKELERLGSKEDLNKKYLLREDLVFLKQEKLELKNNYSDLIDALDVSLEESYEEIYKKIIDLYVNEINTASEKDGDISDLVSMIENKLKQAKFDIEKLAQKIFVYNFLVRKPSFVFPYGMINREKSFNSNIELDVNDLTEMASILGVASPQLGYMQEALNNNTIPIKNIITKKEKDRTLDILKNQDKQLYSEAGYPGIKKSISNSIQKDESNFVSLDYKMKKIISTDFPPEVKNIISQIYNYFEDEKARTEHLSSNQILVELCMKLRNYNNLFMNAENNFYTKEQYITDYNEAIITAKAQLHDGPGYPWYIGYDNTLLSTLWNKLLPLFKLTTKFDKVLIALNNKPSFENLIKPKMEIKSYNQSHVLMQPLYNPNVISHGKRREDTISKKAAPQEEVTKEVASENKNNPESQSPKF